MYAIVMCGGKQLKVAAGDKVAVELLDGEPGSAVVLDKVLMVVGEGSTKIGAPFVAGAKVKATVEAVEKDKKVIIFKKRRRQNSRRKMGHRQTHTVLKITAIEA
jgi:large subunit ribosomal protein L21